METKAHSQFDQGYIFRRPEIEGVLSQGYLAFLKEAGIGDLDKTPNLFVAKYVLKDDERVEETARKGVIDCKYAKDGTVVNISQPNARKLIYGLGGIVLPTGIMYKLVIPGLKQAAQEGNESARDTLYEMTDRYTEWLEDRVLDDNRLLVGKAETQISLPDEDGRFDGQDIDESGYPARVKAQGEFSYWHVNKDERAAIRGRGSELVLNLDGVPSIEGGRLGVRFAKFFSE